MRERIRELNDAFRTTFCGGRVIMSAGVASLPGDIRAEILDKVRTFTAFTEDNDPHGEHDFGVVHIAGHRVFWKIDYYDAACEYGSEDPANAAVTTRVLTILLRRRILARLARAFLCALCLHVDHPLRSEPKHSRNDSTVPSPSP